MKLITLNIRHGGGKRVPRILEYLRALNADVIVLTEFRENSNAIALRAGLGESGFRFFAGASVAAKINSVCVFSQQPFVPRTYAELSTHDRHRLISAHFDDAAVYGVYFSQNNAKASLFKYLAAGGHRPTETDFYIIGDVNTGLHFQDEEQATFYCTEEFEALIESGVIDSWRSRNPEAKEFSWYSNQGNGFRVDHVFSSRDADVKIQSVYYDHTPREEGVTDHSALVVENVS
jgi:exodeoxyribonuclease-3